MPLPVQCHSLLKEIPNDAERMALVNERGWVMDESLFIDTVIVMVIISAYVCVM